MRMPALRSDSLLGGLRSPVYLRWQAGLQVLWLIALVQAPLVVKGFDWHWFGPTLVSIPVYLFPLIWSYCFDVQLIHVGVVFVGGLAGGVSNFLYIRGARRDVQLRLSQDEVRRLATLAERERIGRDLHDLLGHTLSLITLKSELARRLALADPARAQQEMEEVERVARHALAEVRHAVTGMRAGDLGSELVSARLMLEASDVSLHVERPEVFSLPASAEAALSLVLREAVTNIHRHSRATEARVVITCSGEEFSMRIMDNGCGGMAAHGNGVSGMRERVRQIGGQLVIDSPERHGTVIDVGVSMVPMLTERVA